MLLWNCEGIRGALNLFQEVNPFGKFDIVLFTETFAVTPISYPNFYSQEVLATKGNAGRPSAGLSILTKPSQNSVRVASSQFFLAVRTDFADVILFYIPPKTDMEQVLQVVDEGLAELDSSRTWIVAGDFNCRIDTGSRGEELVDHLNEAHGLSCVNDKLCATYFCKHGSSCIDLVFTNKPGQMKSPLEIKRVVERKHAWVTSVWNRLLRQSESQQVENKRLSRSVNLELLNHALESTQREIDNGDVNAAAQSLTDSIVSSTTYVKTRRLIHKKWFDEECRALKATLLRLQPSNVEEYWTLRRRYRRLLKEKREAFEDRELQQKLEKAESTPWNLFRKAKNTYSSPIELSKWEDHFANIFDPDHSPPRVSLPVTHNEDCNIEGWMNDPITEYEVRCAVDSLKLRKAPGPDLITNELLKVSRDIISPVLTSLFNSCLTCEQVPDVWRKALVKTLYKGSGSREDPNNYRGITLQNVLYKVLTSIVNRRVIQHVDDLLPDQQYGFRRGRSTHQAIHILTDKIKSTLAGKERLYAVFVDFKKAFPSVDRALLIPKLSNVGVKGRLLGLIASCLSYNKLVISDGLRQTDEIVQHRGLPEGDTLAPTEYLIFASDLADTLSAVADVDFLMFADDLVIYSKNRQQVQRALDVLADWCRQNKITVNKSKTLAMKFRKGGRLCSDDILNFDGERLAFTNEYTYLGVTLQTTMQSFTKHVKAKKKKALSGISALKHLPQTSLKTAKKIFNMKIRPIVEYSLRGIAQFLTVANLHELDKVKSAFFKKALGLHSSASSTFALGLCDESQYCEELVKGGFDFKRQVISEYREDIEERVWRNITERFTDGPAFLTSDWKDFGRKDRHVLTRTTYHGFHHRLCVDMCYSPVPEEATCICRLCLQPAPRLHILACPAGSGLSTAEFIRQISS